jgi:hypothetical protein
MCQDLVVRLTLHAEHGTELCHICLSLAPFYRLQKKTWVQACGVRYFTLVDSYNRVRVRVKRDAEVVV